MLKNGVTKAPPLEYAVCGAQMKHLADLQLTAAFGASRVYRCYSCECAVGTIKPRWRSASDLKRSTKAQPHSPPNPVRGVLAANAIQKLEDDRDKATKSGAPT